MTEPAMLGSLKICFDTVFIDLVILYDGAYYTGRSWSVTCDTGALGAGSDKASSAQVLGWYMYIK